MFWWRKRNEGFEWRDYVRTTILVRREQRKQRLKDAQNAAVQHVKEAGRRGVEAGFEGAKVAGKGVWSHLISGGARFGQGAVRWGRRLGAATLAGLGAAAGGLSTFGGRVGGPVGQRLEPLLAIVRRDRVWLTLMVVAALAGMGAVYRWFNFGWDGDVVVAGSLAGVSLLLLLLSAATASPRAQPRAGDGRDSLLSRLKGSDFDLPETAGGLVPKAALALLVCAVIAAGGAGLYFAGSWASGFLASGASGDGDVAETTAVVESELKGRATALSGDRLRVGRTVVALDGIEAPEAGQSCERKSGAWRCGAAAKDALAALVRRRQVHCEVLDEDDGEVRGRCAVGDADIAETLVRNGHVFAGGGFFNRYASLEGEAQDAGRGLWAGSVERPQDYRDKRWEEAKKDAPDGCPIKGRIRAGARTYVLPWAASYEKVQVRESRGERWFCSESDAKDAGWSRSSAS